MPPLVTGQIPRREEAGCSLRGQEQGVNCRAGRAGQRQQEGVGRVNVEQGWRPRGVTYRIVSRKSPWSEGS